MKLWSIAFLALGVSAGLMPVAFAAAEPPVADPGAAAAVQCLIDVGRDGCGSVFVGGAVGPARPWVRLNQRLRFDLGPLESVTYVGAIADGEANLAPGQKLSPKLRYSIFPMDVYAVKFRHREMTFFVAPPDADGKIRHLRFYEGAPDDLYGTRG